MLISYSAGTVAEDRFTTTIVDDEFGTVVSGDKDPSGWIFVIKVYEERNLPVVPNLMRAIYNWTRRPSNVTMDTVIEWNRQHNIHWHKYGKDIEKYMLLM